MAEENPLPSDDDVEGAAGLPADWRDLSPEAKKVLLHKLRGRHVSLGLGGPRTWRSLARPKQLSPNDPLHHLPDENGFRCGCDGLDEKFNLWLFMAGRGVGKTWAGANWIIEQAFKQPGTMWAVVAPTFRDVRVTCFEGPSGIRRQLEPGEEAQWRRNELRLDLVNGSILYGYSADQPERLRGSNLSGAWCLAEGTLITTLRGDVPVENISTNDYVLTRSGWKAVIASGLTRENAPLLEIRTSAGRVLRCTSDHKILVDGAWCAAQDVEPGGTLATCPTNSSMAPLRGVSGKENFSSSTTNQGGISAQTESSWLTLSGAGPTVQFQPEWTSTTGTRIEPMTGSKILSWSSQENINAGTLLMRTDTFRQRHMKAESLEHWHSGLSENRKLGHVNFAEKSTRPSPHTLAIAANRVVTGRDTIVSVRSSGWSDVYDITVEGAHEFFANGILVHNCDEMGSWQYEETWYEGLVPALRIGEHPRVLVTTTPRPTKLVRDLYSRRDGTVHITTASTWENAKNLSAAALDELRRRYEGTRLGRQELEGELLEDLEGALWKRSDIDAARVRLADVPELVRIVVGIDPAVTSTEESDETGIIVAGDDGHGHGYVLADYSMKGSPEACMREAVRAYKRHGADCIVAEVNNGGDFIGAVVRAVDPDVPYRTVRASRGKALRAEPVSALAEQRRLHHVGSLAELEDQLCSYVPGIGASPDRMDALVWAVFELRGLSQASWLSAYGVARCASCDHAYATGMKECPRCRTANPLEAERLAVRTEDEAEPDEPQPGGWASVYGIKRCPQGHAYSQKNGTSGCPRCRSGGLNFLKGAGKGLSAGGGSGMIRM